MSREPSKGALEDAREWLANWEFGMSTYVDSLARLLDAHAAKARLEQMIETRRVLGLGEATFRKWLKERIAALEQAVKP